MADSTARRLLKKAAELLGEDALAVEMRVPRTTLDLWLRGLATMPDRKIALLADVFDKFGRPEN